MTVENIEEKRLEIGIFEQRKYGRVPAGGCCMGLRTSTSVFQTKEDVNSLIDSGISSCNVSDQSSALLLLALGEGIPDGLHICQSRWGGNRAVN